MLSILEMILKYKRTVIAVTLAAGVISAAITLIIPKRYISKMAFMPAGVEEELSGSGGYFSRLGSLGETYSDILRVRRNFIIDYVVRSGEMAALMDQRFDLGKMYGTDNPEEIREKLARSTSVYVRDEGVLELGVEAEDPVLARDMTAAYAELIDSIFVELVVEGAESRREYLESEYARRRKAVQAADSSIAAFMNEYGVFSIDEQMEGALKVLEFLGGRRSGLELERNLAKVSMLGGTPRLKKLSLELEMIDDEIDRIVNGRGWPGLFPPLNKLPELSARYMALVSERMMQEFALAYVKISLEEAELAASRRISVIRIIDPPYVPEMRSWPKRKQIVLVLTAAALFWTCFALLLRERIRESRSEKYAAAPEGGICHGQGLAVRERHKSP